MKLPQKPFRWSHPELTPDSCRPQPSRQVAGPSRPLPAISMTLWMFLDVLERPWMVGRGRFRLFRRFLFA